MAVAEKGEGAAAAAPQAPKTPATPVAKASDNKKSITLTFEGDADLELHKRIQAKADEEDRTPSIELLRFVRKHFPKDTPAA